MSPTPPRRVIGVVLTWFALTGLVLGVGRVAQRDLGVAGVAALALLTVVGVGEAARLRPSPVPPPRPPADFGVDRPFARLAALTERVRWGVMSSYHFQVALRPLLTGLAEDRLRRRGVDLQRHPTDPQAPLPDHRTLDVLTRRIEEL